MKRFFTLLLLAIFVTGIQAQQKVTLRDIAQGTYRAQGISGLKPMLDGEHYTQISSDHKRIVKYSFKTGEEVGTLFDVTTARDCDLKSFDDYILSPDEKLILIQTETKPIYRHSFTAVYYIYNVKNNKMEPLSNNGPQQVPLFSPDGNQIAFVRNNNIYLVKLLFGNSESQVTKDGEYNHVLNGIPDWVYEEEFSFNRAFDFSADSKMIAYVRFDESAVPMFSFPWYKGLAPEKASYATYPGAYEYKYPKAGEVNSKVSVHTYDIKSHVTRKMDLQIDSDGYIPRIKFTSDPEKLAITLRRGPIIYTFEGVDNGEDLQTLRIPREAKIEALPYQADLLEGIVALRVTGCRKKAAVNPALYAEDAAPEERVTLQAIPYYAWCNRGMTHMRVWMQE